MTSIGIIGAGFGGVGVAAELLRHGHDDVRLWERADGIGGVWRENRYPGAACDVPSPLYSFSWAPERSWTRRYAGQAEILAYLRRVADAEGVTARTRFGATVVGAEWSEAEASWTVRFDDGRTEQVDVLISAVGQLATPRSPDLPGRDAFVAGGGEVVHAAGWPDGFDARGRRIAVVGSAATAVQLVPKLAAEASELVVFSRSANHVLPKFDGPLPRWYGPGIALERRFWAAIGEQLSRAMDPATPQAAVFTALTRFQLARQVRDPALRRALTPAHRLGCKRVLFSNDYYPALQRPNVTLVTEGVAGFTPTGVRAADGREFDVDAVVTATGFDAQQFLDRIEVRGRGGRLLHDHWSGGARAHLGMYVPGFPNLFVCYGPNTNLGGSSILLMEEAQARHLRQVVDRMRRTGASTVEVTDRAEAEWDADVQGRLADSVWTGCASWYRHPETGRVTSNWPGGTTEYARRTAVLEPTDFAWGGRELPAEAYPPEPWQLRGRAIVSAFLVPESAMPDDGPARPDGWEPVRSGRHRIVGVASIAYVAGGVLRYEELLEAHLVARGNELRVQIPRIWVDSPASLAGGRGLWSIPKHLAEFERTEQDAATAVDVRVDGTAIVAVRARRTALGLRGIRAPLPMANRLDGREVLAPASMAGAVRLARASWRFAPDGPLGHLAGRRPFLSVAMPDAAIVFGSGRRLVARGASGGSGGSGGGLAANLQPSGD
ncbi:FAD-dependent oxidoreductase [Agromyces sp. MMS24-JH15]|uniref:FAD-dependent oxidoreductase n=1 Tax=Agromyces sp. MMS24-JH15 TaxID=3243765 RepID=UPI0037485338